MVLLDLTSINNTVVAKFQSLLNQTTLSILDSNNNNYNISVSSNILNIYSSNNKNGIIYANDILKVNNININNITNTVPLTFPNSDYILSSYSFQSSDNFNNYNNYNVFDLNPDTLWKSDSVFNLDGSFNILYTNYLT